MEKLELITALRKYVADGKANTISQKIFALFFADWLQELRVPHDEKYYQWSYIDRRLPELAVAASENLRTGTDDTACFYRSRWESEVHEKVPNITDLGESSMTIQGLRSLDLEDLLSKVKGILGES